MRRRTVLIGLSLVCALAASAFAAPGAMALKGTTAYECKAVEGGGEFSDEHCTKEEKGGSYEHVLIPSGATKVKVTNTETGNSTVTKMKVTVGGIAVEIQAKGFSSCIGTIENTVNAKGQMEVVGEGCGEFTELKVLKPLNKEGKEICKAKEPIALNSGLAGNTEVKEEEKEEPPIRGTGYFPPGSFGEGVFTEVTLEDNGALKCSIKGTYPITGSVHANMPLEEGKLDGPTLRFTTAQTEKTLKMGTGAAAFEGTFTLRAANETAPPIALTTTES